MNIDITKPLRRFITVTGGGEKCEIWGRIRYERLPTFCYECGIIGHSKTECGKISADENSDISIKQYGDWLRVSPLAKGSQRWKTGGITTSEKQPEIQNKI